MNVLTVIPARGGSKRIPRKNLIRLAGIPLIGYSIGHAKRSKLVNRIVVSTDDEEIAYTSRLYGAEVIKRPKELSSDTASSESALMHVLDYLEEQEKYSPDLMVFLQCTSPLRNENDIDDAINTLIKLNADSLFSAGRFKKYIWELKEGIVSPINYDYNHRWREQDFPYQVEENGSIYVIKPFVLKQYNNRLGGKIAIYETDEFCSIQIDTYEDILLTEYILNNVKKYKV